MKKITLLLLMCFSSFIGFSQGLVEGFDNTAAPSGGVLALDSGSWAIFDNGIGTQGSWLPTASPTLIHQGTRAMQINGTNDNLGIGNTSQDWLVTPAVVVPNNGQLKFFTRLQTAANQGSIFQIRISTTSQTDAASFTTLQEWNELNLNVSYNTYEEKTVPLNLPAGSTVYVAFVMLNTQLGNTVSSERWLIDTVNIVEQCLDPTNLTASAVTQSGANLSWLNPSGATSWEIEIVSGTTPTPTQHGVVYNGALPYAATGTATGTPLVQVPFLPNTEYKYYVRAICSGSNTSSAWVGPFSFTTGAPGFTCSSAIPITALPYTTTDNTANYGDTFDANQGTGCGSTVNYMTGNDVFYSYTATQTGVISISMTPTATNTSIFVYNGCANVGVSCVAGVANAQTTVREIPALAVTAGVTYVIVISKNGTPATGAYTLNIQIVNCTPPTNLNVTNVSATSATLTWDNPGGLASTWQVALQDAGTPMPTTDAGVVTVTTNTAYQPTLQNSYAYQYYVRAQCPDGSYSAWAGPYLFNSAQVAASIPFTEGFEGTNTFALNNGTQVNKWAVGSATNNGGTNSLYISNDNGVSNAYTIASAISVVQAYRDIAVPAGTNELNLAFDWKAAGESSFDYLRVWTVPTSFTPTPGTQITAGAGRVQLGANMNLTPNYTTVNYVIPATALAGQTMRLVFEWRNDNSAGTQPPAAIDNINLTVITCSAPSALLLQSVGQTTAGISWTAPASGAASYDYYVSSTNTNPAAGVTVTGNVSTTTATLTGLLPSTTNYVWVRSNCGIDGTSTWTGPVTVITTQIPGTLAYIDGFEGTNQWSLINGTQVNKWVVGTATNNGGTQSLYISNDNGATNAYTITSTSVVQAYRDIAIPATAGDLNVSFDWRAVGQGFGPTTFNDYFRVWAVPTTFNPTPGTQITAGAGRVQLGTSTNNSANYTTSNYVLPSVGFAGQTLRLVFEWRNDASTGTQTPAAIDNVNISIIICAAPTALAVNTVNQTSGSFSWTAPASGAISYDYYVSTTNTAPVAATAATGNVTTTNATALGLQPSTTYYVWVRTNCGATDGNSTWTGPVQLITTQIPADLTYVDGFEGTNQWSIVNGTQVNKWVIGTATSNGGTQSLYITNDNGVSNAYTVNTISVVQAYRDINVPATAAELNVAFDWRAAGESSFDYLRVWAVPTTFNPTPGTQITAGAGRVQLGANMNQTPNYTTVNYVLPTTGFAGQTMRLVFEWRNDGSAGTQPPAAIDNVNINVITCSAPSALIVNTANQTGGSFSWTAPANGAASYDYYISTTNTPPTSTSEVVNVTPTNATVTGLQPSTTHYVWVRSNCGAVDGTSIWVGPVQLITSQIPGELNYIDGFEGTNGWTLNNGTQVNKWIVGTATSNGGTQSLYISNNNADNAYTISSTSVVHAYRDIQMPAVVGDLSLTFDWKAIGQGFTTTFNDYFRVWAVPTTFNPTPGTQITAGSGRVQIGANFNNSAIWQTPNYIFSATPFSGQAMRLVFEWRNDGSSGTQPPAAIDNVNLSQLTCPAPINLIAESNPLNSDLILSWTPVGAETQWEVVAQIAGTGAPVSGQIVNETSLTFSPLPGTFYEFFVRAICSPTDSSFWAGPAAFSIFTPPGCASVDLVGVGVDIVDQEIILCAEEDNCVNLSATYFGIGATTSYEVASIDYNPPFPFTGGTEMPITADDDYTPSFDLPFNFCFFGESYDYVRVGDNGVIAFGLPYTTTYGEYCSWVLDGPIPNPAFTIKNAIYGVFQDMLTTNNPGANTSINYQVLGTYPCRAFVVNFNEVPAFGTACQDAQYRTTTQIVLYEISNIIEVYVKNRTACSGWQQGEGVIGIQNAAGTLAYVPPGRNTGAWNATNEAWRFSPNGESNVDFQWLKDGVFFSDQQDIQVCVTELTTMVAQATYTTCDGTVITKENQVIIRTTEPLPTNDPVDILSCSSTGNPIFDLTPNTATIIGSNSATDLIIEYYLTQAEAEVGDSATAILTPEAYAGTPGQTIFVRISYPGSDCFFVKTFQLQLGSNTPSVTTFSYSTPICIGNATNPLPIPVTGFTAGGTYSSNDVTVNATTGEIDMTTATAGTHDITYTIIPAGCNEGGSFTAQIVINALPVADVITDVVVCDSYVLQPLSANNNYFTAPNGGGSALTAGTAITTSQLIYIFSSTGVGCSDESNFNVTINESPIVSVTGACQGADYIIEATILNDNLSADNFIFSWTDSDGNSVGGNTSTITVSVSGEYFVNVTPVATSTVDCSVDQSFTANGTTCMIPKGISPNGDGKNDTFDLTGLQVRKISIFNRYGTIVYDYSNYTDQWHGQSNKGDELPDGTYYYSFEREGGESKTGWVYINRQRN